jgi:hypothetical protein
MRFFPKVDSPCFSGSRKGVFLQPVTNARQDDASDVPVVFSSFVMSERTAHSGLQFGFFGDTFGIAAFLAVRLFLAHGTNFQMWGCFLGSK